MDVKGAHANWCLQVTAALPEPAQAQAPAPLERALPEWAALQPALLEWAAQPPPAPPLFKLPSFQRCRRAFCSCRATSSWRSNWLACNTSHTACWKAYMYSR